MSDDESFTFRRERRALTTVARFFAGSLGAILCGSFALSVLRDSGDIARFAWTEGADLLGTYGGAGIIAIPFIALLTAFLRAGRTLPVVQVSLDRETKTPSLFFRTADGQTHQVNAADITTAHWIHLDDGRERIVMTLGRGLETGDRFVFEGPSEKLTALIAPVTEDSQAEIELTRSRLFVGGFVMVLSAIGGALLSTPVFESVAARAQSLGVLTSQTADAWQLALFVSISSLTALGMSFALAARKARLGIEGILVRGPVFERFVSSSRLGRARSVGGAIVVPVKRGFPLLIPSFGCDEDTVAALLSGIESLRTAADAPPPSPAIERLLGSWREAIKNPRSAGGYRDAGIPFNELVAQLRSARSSQDERVGSAALMIASGDDDARKEVRRVAQLMVLDDTRERLLELVEPPAELDTPDEAAREADADADADEVSAARQPERLSA